MTSKQTTVATGAGLGRLAEPAQPGTHLVWLWKCFRTCHRSSGATKATTIAALIGRAFSQ